MNTAMTPTATMSLFIYSFFDISDVATYINSTKYHLFQKQNYRVRKFSDVVYRKSETTVIGFLSRISHTVERKRTQPRWSYHARKFKLFRRQFVEIRKQLAMPYDAGATKRRTSASYRERNRCGSWRTVWLITQTTCTSGWAAPPIVAGRQRDVPTEGEAYCWSTGFHHSTASLTHTHTHACAISSTNNLALLLH